ncbi:hypothetical protein [Polaribacter cellanae]|uniref:Uncharacterized protein n=1 Tax=Polaribacter cellanae TaxID=2818493 RepID=A0A975CQ42_9FLAO|nr:hypothetical protein [Polaribacter cellanae]QTE21131.1 hypothetical protein J3359_09735 [Polaribacter cellanae]
MAVDKNKSRREKISFGYINKKQYEFIPAEDVAASNQRIREFMSPLVKEHAVKEAISRKSASKIVLNS